MTKEEANDILRKYAEAIGVTDAGDFKGFRKILSESEYPHLAKLHDEYLGNGTTAKGVEKFITEAREHILAENSKLGKILK